MHPAGPLSCPTAGSGLPVGLSFGDGLQRPGHGFTFCHHCRHGLRRCPDRRRPQGRHGRRAQHAGQRGLGRPHHRRLAPTPRHRTPRPDRVARDGAELRKEVAQYREALYLHAYEDLHLREHFNTTVTSAELQAFLDEQPDLFHRRAAYRALGGLPGRGAFPPSIRGYRNSSRPTIPKSPPWPAGARTPDALRPRRRAVVDLGAGRRRPARPEHPPAVLRRHQNRLVRRHGPAAPSISAPCCSSPNASPRAPSAPGTWPTASELLLHRRRNCTLSDMRQQAVRRLAEAALSKQDHDAAPAASPDRNPQNDTP